MRSCMAASEETLGSYDCYISDFPHRCAKFLISHSSLTVMSHSPSPPAPASDPRFLSTPRKSCVTWGPGSLPASDASPWGGRSPFTQQSFCHELTSYHTFAQSSPTLFLQLTSSPQLAFILSCSQTPADQASPLYLQKMEPTNPVSCFQLNTYAHLTALITLPPTSAYVSLFFSFLVPRTPPATCSRVHLCTSSWAPYC